MEDCRQQMRNAEHFKGDRNMLLRLLFGVDQNWTLLEIRRHLLEKGYDKLLVDDLGPPTGGFQTLSRTQGDEEVVLQADWDVLKYGDPTVGADAHGNRIEVGLLGVPGAEEGQYGDVPLVVCLDVDDQGVAALSAMLMAACVYTERGMDGCQRSVGTPTLWVSLPKEEGGPFVGYIRKPVGTKVIEEWTPYEDLKGAES